MQDNIYTGEVARERIMKGIIRASEVIGGTLGTAGKNVLIETFASPFHYPTNDGISALGSMRFADPLEEIGRQILYEAVSRTNNKNGDGSSTCTVLCASILEEGMKHLDEVSAMDMKKSLEDCLPLIEKSLKEQRKELIDKDGNIDFKLLEQTATISAESEEIGKIIADIYREIGKDGIINWQASKDNTDSYTIGTGIKIDGATYVSRYMCDAEGDGFTYQATIENPLVLLAKSKITSQGEMNSFISELQNADVKDLVIFVDEMDAPILNSFILARAPQTLGIRFLIIKMPTVFNDLWWEDLEKASGGRVISPASGIKMKDVKMAYLGRFGRIMVNRDGTFIDGIQDLSNHVMGLKVDGSDEALARAARLNTKTATYFVGANSESTLRQKRDKVEDAINSAWSAMQNGILPGGGIALKNCAYPDVLGETVGGEILCDALRKPLEQIMQNAGQRWEDKHEKIVGAHGFNSKTGKIVDMFEHGIVDSFDVVMGAIKNAIGVASGILTCGTVVLLSRSENSVDDAIRNIIQNPS